MRWLILLCVFVETWWMGEPSPRPYLETEIWQRTGSDTTWTMRKSERPDEDGIVKDAVCGPIWIKARWRWDLYKTFLEPGATTHPPPPQTLYGSWSPVYYVSPQGEQRKAPPRTRIRVP